MSIPTELPRGWNVYQPRPVSMRELVEEHLFHEYQKNPVFHAAVQRHDPDADPVSCLVECVKVLVKHNELLQAQLIQAMRVASVTNIVRAPYNPTGEDRFTAELAPQKGSVVVLPYNHFDAIAQPFGPAANDGADEPTILNKPTE